MLEGIADILLQTSVLKYKIYSDALADKAALLSGFD